MKNGLNKVEKKAVELTDDANSIIESVQDLVSIDKIDESALVEDVRRGKIKLMTLWKSCTAKGEYSYWKM